jgi:hypothetical protein
VRLDCLLQVLFERSGARMETDGHLVYWGNTAGWSTAYQRLRTAVVDGLSAMDLREQGTPIHIRLKGLSP